MIKLYHTRCEKPGCCHFTADTEFSFSDYIIFIIIIILFSITTLLWVDLCVIDNNRVHSSQTIFVKIENHMCIGMFCYCWLCLSLFSFRRQKQKLWKYNLTIAVSHWTCVTESMEMWQNFKVPKSWLFSMFFPKYLGLGCLSAYTVPLLSQITGYFLVFHL